MNKQYVGAGIVARRFSSMSLTRLHLAFFHSRKFDDYSLLACCSIWTTVTKINSTVSIKGSFSPSLSGSQHFTSLFRLYVSLDSKWSRWLRDSHGSLTEEVRLPGQLVFTVIRFPSLELGGLLFKLEIDY